MNSQKQKMRQLQKMSPKQMMLMRMLQMSNQSLEQMIKEEIEKNPLLEVEASSGAMESMDSGRDEPGDEALDFMDDEYKEYQEYDPNREYRERDYADEESFMDFLHEQVGMLTLDERKLLIVEEILGSLDDSGWLGRDLMLIENDLAFRKGVEVSHEELESALKIVQSLEPAGVGARTLGECLLLQLERVQPQTYEVKCARAIVENCFDLMTKHHYEAISERLEIDMESVAAAEACIRRLNPKPCATESARNTDVNYIIPDFVISRSGGSLSCMLNDGMMPKLMTSRYYEEMLQEMLSIRKPTAGERETLEFLKSKDEDAHDFLDNISQRHQTLLRTMEIIVKRQRQYLLTGNVSDMKPLMQHEVAEILGMDDSTISRVVNSKYVQTDFGTFPLKHFFSQSQMNLEGDEVATEAVRHHLQLLVENEDKTSPKTDDQLAEEMKEAGYSISRRTVAKYRDMMGIPVARLRRILTLLLLLLSLGGLSAQEPMSYYDSLAYHQMHPTTRKSTPKKNDQNTKAARPQTRKATPVDSALLKSDEAIDNLYNATRPRPSMMWYGNHFSQNRVKPENFHIDSLPDAVNLQLVKSDSDFCFPMKNIITSPYGWRWNRAHRGVDIRLNTGDPVRCVFPGVVRIASPMGAYGNLVVVRHYNGLETVYGHLSKIQVKPNQEVTAGDILGLGGSTGRSTGPHLHFEVRFEYEPFDPEWILDFQNYTLRTHRLHLDKTYFGISNPVKGGGSYKADKSYVKEQDAKRAEKRPIYYIVRKDDDIETIAQYYRTTPEKIKELNPEMKKLKKGLKIRVR